MRSSIFWKLVHSARWASRWFWQVNAQDATWPTLPLEEAGGAPPEQHSGSASANVGLAGSSVAQKGARIASHGKLGTSSNEAYSKQGRSSAATGCAGLSHSETGKRNALGNDSGAVGASGSSTASRGASGAQASSVGVSSSAIGESGPARVADEGGGFADTATIRPPRRVKKAKGSSVGALGAVGEVVGYKSITLKLPPELSDDDREALYGMLGLPQPVPKRAPPTRRTPALSTGVIGAAAAISSTHSGASSSARAALGSASGCATLSARAAGRGARRDRMAFILALLEAAEEDETLA